MFNWRKPDVPEDQVAKFKPEPVPPKPLFPAPAEAVPPATVTPVPAAAAPAAAPEPVAPVAIQRPCVPSPPKEALFMSSSRPHVPTPPGGFGTSSSLNAPPQQSVRTSLRPDAERRVLVIGKGISVIGTVSDAERVVVEGTLESQLVRAAEFSVAPGGFFKGEAEVEEAEIAGTVEGTITARASLQVRAPGKLLGVARCRRLQVEDGGQISGKVEMLTDTPAEPAPVAHEAPASLGSISTEARPSAMPIKPDLIG